MNKTIQSIWSCDAATGDLYENNRPAGKLITGNSPNPGAWLRIIQQANASAELFAALEACLSVDFDCTDEHANEQTNKIREQARAALEKAGRELK